MQPTSSSPGSPGASSTASASSSWKSFHGGPPPGRPAAGRSPLTGAASWASSQAVPTLGWPAKPSSSPGVKIRIRPSAASSTKTVSENPSSAATSCRRSSGTSAPSRKTPSGLPKLHSASQKTRRTCSSATPRPPLCACSPLPSQDRQEVFDLVRRDLDPVVVPFLALDLDEAAEGVLAQGAQDQLRVGGDLDRLAERRGELLDPLVSQLLLREVVQVLLHRLRQLVALFDAFESRLQHPGEAEV